MKKRIGDRHSLREQADSAKTQESNAIISNVSGICKSIRVSDSECLSECGNTYEPRLGFKYCPYCGNELELIF